MAVTIKENLATQLELLHEASKKELLPSELAQITCAMAELIQSVPDTLLGREGAQMSLKTVPTCQLVEELKQREGVSVQVFGPYVEWKTEGEGPAVVLIVED